MSEPVISQARHFCFFGRQTIQIVEAQRDGKRFVVCADEKLIAFMELEAAIRVPAERREDCGAREIKLDKLSPD